MAEENGFTSWKLDMLDAISCDPATTEMDFRVAYRIMQHVNKESRVAHVSMDRLAAQVGVSRATLMRSVKRLQGVSDPKRKDHRPTAWIEAKRATRTSAYFYQFSDKAMNAVLDGKLDREQRAKLIMKERKQSLLHIAGVKGRGVFDVADVQPQLSSDVADGVTVDVADGVNTDVADVRPIHLCVNYENITPINTSLEREHNTQSDLSDNPYARMKAGE